MYIIDKDKIGKTYYTYSNHLGSIIALINASGTIEQEQSFDPWGRRRLTNWTYSNTPAITLLDLGFTGQEHLNEFNLVNLNGRLYDPVLGQILSPDNFISMPGFAQNYNRYSYCYNNPLVYVDPDGNNPLLIIGLAIVGAYLGGVGTNGGELNPGQWNWQSPATYFGIVGGGILGATGGYYMLHGGLQLALGIGTPLGGAYLVGQGSNWSFNYTTANGGGGGFSLTSTNSLSPTDLVNQQISMSISSLPESQKKYFGLKTFVPYGIIEVGPLWMVGWEQEWSSLGQPEFLESLIPIWGSGRAAFDDYQNGRWGWGTFNTALAISDIFLVKSLVTAAGKATAGTAWKFGSNTWGATRKWMLKTGQVEAGKPLHHWAISQAFAKKAGIEGIANQPWNLIKFETQSFHMRAAHGQMYFGREGYGVLGQFLYGTPNWFKASIVSGGGRIID